MYTNSMQKELFCNFIFATKRFVAMCDFRMANAANTGHAGGPSFVYRGQAPDLV